MKKNYKKIIFSIFLFILLSFPFYLLAQDQTDFGLSETAKSAGLYQEGAEVPSPAALIGRIIGVVLAFVGVIFLILIIYGGILWMTAGGNEEKIKKAKSILTTALIGLVIILTGYTITSFVIS